MSETYTWLAHFADGRVFHEVDADGMEHGWAEATQYAVIAIELVPAQGIGTSIVVNIPADVIPVFFRRRTITLDDHPTPTTVTFAGWRINGVLTAIRAYDDGSVALMQGDEQGA